MSPLTERKDREIKLPIYARYGVRHAWLVDPRKHALEALAAIDGEWSVIGRFTDSDTVVAEPFEAVSIDLAGYCWA